MVTNISNLDSLRNKQCKIDAEGFLSCLEAEQAKLNKTPSLQPADCRHNSDCLNPEDRNVLPGNMTQVYDNKTHKWMWVPRSAAADIALNSGEAPKVNVITGGGVSGGTPTGGAEISGGILWNPGTGDVGFFVSPGVPVGYNFGADGFVGFVMGGPENVYGPTINHNYSLGFASVTTIHDPKTGEFLGMTAGVGKSSAALGYSAAYDVTHGCATGVGCK
jgi:hypothetical protein